MAKAHVLREIRRQREIVQAEADAKCAGYEEQITALRTALQAATTADVMADSSALDAANARADKLAAEVARLKAEINQLEATVLAGLPEPAAKPAPPKPAPEKKPILPSRAKKNCKKCDWSGRIRGNKCPKCNARVT
jgi:hypothetical protein